MSKSPILSAADLHKTFKVSSHNYSTAVLTALGQVSLQLSAGETLGIAGESGCGKSTLAKIMAGLMEPDGGSVLYKGTKLSQLGQGERTLFRRKTQMIFQDPFSSLNPRMRIGDSIAEPLKIIGTSTVRQREELARIMAAVGLQSDAANRFPDEFSGGQRQRIGIARALAASPEILIADEPVSSLDISIQAQIINILLQMKTDFALSMMIVSHNLLVLRHICDRIIIMYLGEIVECGPASMLFQRCRHPYTEALIAAIPGLHIAAVPKSELLQDDLPSALSIPSGCRFHPRCRHAVDLCRHEVPKTVEYARGHSAACHLSNRLYD
ncbi:MAG: ATP-binding cassette domain-containing protein [Desulfuromonadaceae bacterium]|nr:ATP-binding cassette domain-containing protein [Desulfuromonadaceae bacterium]MDD2849699.1 ATP-binding cassette domain-containing protein [Desulfuromonadaceae bacterium]MDD4129802.1 ATP-binding cassette domain-containing protein [Desulfuromonadaceae bacterium]